MLAVEKRLEDGVAEAKRQEVLHGLFAEVVVDPVDLVGPKKAQQVAVEGHRAGQVVTEWLLDDHARPGTILFATNQRRASQPFYDGAKELRIGCQVEQAIAGQVPFPFQGVYSLSQSFHAFGSCKV